IRLNGATGAHSAPALLDNEAVGHQLFPDISADGGVLHATWWDSRLDANYSPQRPVGNDADGVTRPALDVFATRSTNGGASWATSPSRSGPIGGTPAPEQISERPLKMRTPPVRTCGSAARRQPRVGSPAIPARGPAASTRTSTATERHSDRRERERAGGFSGHRPLALQHLGQPDRLRLLVDATAESNQPASRR